MSRCTPFRDDGPCAECANVYGYDCVMGVCTFTVSRPSGGDNSQSPTVIYVTASQIALSAALVMGSIALITLLYRICSKPRNRSAAP